MGADRQEGFDLSAYRHEQLRSERARIIGLIAVFSFFGALGCFRIVEPVAGSPAAGLIIALLSATYIAIEFRLLRRVSRAIADTIELGKTELIVHGVLECLFPLIGMSLLISMTALNPFTLLVSPGYSFILILIMLSILRLDLKNTLATGLSASLGYALLVAYVFANQASGETPPHPTAMYINQAIVLILATGVAVFLTMHIRGYFLASLRELQTRNERDKLRQDVEIASEIQRGLLPLSMPVIEGYELAAFSEPASQAGGDYYDCQLIAENRALLSLADVTGHGVGPALVTAACRAYVRAITNESISPTSLVKRVNELLHVDINAGRFVTFALLDLDASAHTAKLLCAGHAPTLYLRAGSARTESIPAHGVPLGIIADTMLDDVREFELATDDLIVLFSDGIHELTNGSGEQFGLERLDAFIVEHRSLTAARLLDELRAKLSAHADGAPPNDDMTVVVVKRAG